MKNIFKQIGLLALILLFSMASSTAVNAQTSEQELTYVKVEVKGLACPFCAYGLEKKLKETDGVKNVKINVEEGIAYLTVLKSKKPAKKMLEKIVTDAGFTPSSIVFSENPFEMKDEN